MNIKRAIVMTGISGLIGMHGMAGAAVGAEEAAKLGKTLTPLGAEKPPARTAPFPHGTAG
jgi:hypothetical protein